MCVCVCACVRACVRARVCVFRNVLFCYVSYDCLYESPNMLASSRRPARTSSHCMDWPIIFIKCTELSDEITMCPFYTESLEALGAI